ncbi:MAG: glycosyltransferase family 39 protein [Desulfocapsaceae bacterium]|jgi:hypothetical protein|nr:glycosyltransferase family 39 protein [Desulfocapsaceae bacterium]
MLPTSIRRNLQLLAIVAVTALLCYQVGAKAFHHSFLTTDEGSYVFQANNFLDGLIARDAPPFGRTLQHQMIIQDVDVGWLSRYPPLHSLWLVPGVAIGNAYLVPAFTAGLSLLFIIFTVRRLGVGAAPVVVLLLCSPYFIFMHGTLLSHASGLACTALMLWAYVSWLVKRRLYWLVVAGAAWGLLFMGRPFSAFLLAIPFGVTSLLILNRERTQETLKATAVFVLCSFSGVVGLFAYNYFAVGDPFTMTYLYYDSTEGLGFGMRHTLGEATHHTLERGLAVLWDNVKAFDLWLLGIRGSLIVLLVFVIAGWRKTITPLLLVGILILPVGYLFFWYEGIQIAGPVYYFESLPFIIVGATLGIAVLAGRLSLDAKRKKLLAVALVSVLLIAAAKHSYEAVKDLSPVYEQRRELSRALENAPPKSIVFLPFWPQQLHFMLNANGLESDPLVVKRHPDEWLGLTRMFPDRTPYRLVRGKHPHLVKLDISKNFIVELPADSFRHDTGVLYSEGDVEEIIATAGENAPGILGYGTLSWLYPGLFNIIYQGTIDGVEKPADAGVVIDLVEYGSGIIIAQNKISRAAPMSGATFCIAVDEAVLVEPRIYFTGLADVRFAGLRIEEAQGTCE